MNTPDASLSHRLWEGFALVDALKLNEAISLADELLRSYKDEKDRAAIQNLKGEALLYSGHYPLASSCFFETIRTAATAGDTALLAEAYVGLSYVYRFLEDYKTAITYAQKAQALLDPAMPGKDLVKSYISEGISCARSGNFEEAGIVLNKALRSSEHIGDNFLLATCIKSLADLFLQKKDYLHAARHYEKALPYAEQSNHFVLSSMILVRLAEALEQSGEPDQALEQAQAGLEKAEKHQFAAGERSAHHVLSHLYERSGKTDLAYKHLRAYLHLHNSSEASRQAHKISRMELDLMKEFKDREIYLLEQVKEKHQSILASIAYAKGLQEAILPVNEIFGDPALDHFVLFQPKEKVGGDFYWAERSAAGFSFSVADCTGHGVPGAMLSLLCSHVLQQSFQNYKTRGLNKVLEGINRSLHSIFGNKNNLVTANDGLDISLCTVEKSTKGAWQLRFAGANHTCIIVRGNEVVQTAYDRTGISLLTSSEYQFTETIYPLKKGDCVYLFSDGYADQFGGPDAASRQNGGKKFKYRQLTDLVQQLSREAMPARRQALKQRLDEWMGGLEQIDDICVLGLQLKGE